MQDKETTQDGSQAEVVATLDPQTEMQDVKTSVPHNAIEQSPTDQAKSTEVQPVGTETTGEHGEPPATRIRY